MRFLHAIVAFFTVVLLFIQQQYVSVCAGPYSNKQSVPAWPRSFSDSPRTPLPLLATDRYVCARAACGHEEFGKPKYKRDPDIAIDNEFIGEPMVRPYTTIKNKP